MKWNRTNSTASTSFLIFALRIRSKASMKFCGLRVNAFRHIYCILHVFQMSWNLYVKSIKSTTYKSLVTIQNQLVAQDDYVQLYVCNYVSGKKKYNNRLMTTTPSVSNLRMKLPSLFHSCIFHPDLGWEKKAHHFSPSSALLWTFANSTCWRHWHLRMAKIAPDLNLVLVECVDSEFGSFCIFIYFSLDFHFDS